MNPILFNTEMVKAIQNGTKTVTRRLLKPHNQVRATRCEYFQGSGLWYDNSVNNWDNDTHIKDYSISPCWITTKIYLKKYAPYKTGDILYVRETWQYVYDLDEHECLIENSGRYIYYADNPIPFSTWIMPDGTKRESMPWRPSIHMPKEAARIFLRVTDVRVERLQDIEISDLQEEGFLNNRYVSQYAAMTTTAFEDFKKVWNSTIKKSDLSKYGWNANPWVWVIEFERISRDEALRTEKKYPAQK